MKVNRITKKGGKITKEQIDKPDPIYNVRIRPEVYEPLVVQAARENRSATAQINHILEQHLKGS